VFISIKLTMKNIKLITGEKWKEKNLLIKKNKNDISLSLSHRVQVSGSILYFSLSVPLSFCILSTSL
jgi:hypothetical protein